MTPQISIKASFLYMLVTALVFITVDSSAYNVALDVTSISTTPASSCTSADGGIEISLDVADLGVSPYDISIDNGTSWESLDQTPIAGVLSVSGQMWGTYNIAIRDAAGVVIFPGYAQILGCTVDVPALIPKGFSIETVADATGYDWTSTIGSISSGQNTTAVVIDFTAEAHLGIGTICVQPTGSFCTAPQTCFDVRIIVFETDCADGVDNNGDGLVDCQDCVECGNTASCSDLDGDGVGNLCDLDDDNDGIPDAFEGEGIDREIELSAISFMSQNIDLAIDSVYDYVGASGDGPGTNLPLSGNSYVSGYDKISGKDLIGFSFGTPISYIVPELRTLRFTYEYFNDISSRDNSNSYSFGGNSEKIYTLKTDIGDLSTSYRFTALEIAHLNAGEWIDFEVVFQIPNNIVPGTVIQITGIELVLETIVGGFSSEFDPADSEVFGVSLKSISYNRDTDSDGIIDMHDLDSDNDGITDRDEAGHTAVDANNDGVIDGGPLAFGVNGLFDGIETTPDSDLKGYSIADSETTPDGIYDAYELDADGDTCYDALEQDVPDVDEDGLAGTGTPVVDEVTGLVIANSYQTPANSNWQTPSVGVCLPEICNDNIDNDGDGEIDCDDGDCPSVLPVVRVSRVVLGGE